MSRKRNLVSGPHSMAPISRCIIFSLVYTRLIMESNTWRQLGENRLMMKLLIVKRWLWSMMNCKRRKLGSEWKVAAQWDQRRPSGWKQYKRCNMGWSHFMTRILTFYDHDDHILWSWRSHEKAQSAMPLVVRTHGQLSFSSTMETTVDWTAWALHPSERWMVVIMMKRIKYERARPQCPVSTGQWPGKRA